MDTDYDCREGSTPHTCADLVAILDAATNLVSMLETAIGEQELDTAWPVAAADYSDRKVWATPQEIAPTESVSVWTIYRLCKSPSQRFAVLIGDGRWQIHRERFAKRNR
ncbi:hypothetical protein [Phyllobacterium ifriqiyense]|uniref:hypothetical protein n=1 Tax=Phyllobacterium ifriqiyense TaxID=314238 RepID=UPI003390CFBC